MAVTTIRPRLDDSAHSSLRILTHALPAPSNEGFAFPTIISEVQSPLSPERTTWISHWHAVSGRFNLSQLPTTPPTTPAPPHEGEDYFTTKVFDSAVAVPDYQSMETGRPKLPGSVPSITTPRPAVQPSTVHISITERYIPPASATEFINLFDPASGRSLLSDRLVELSDRSGMLTFVYPTREGGRTFLRHYLGKCLDPLLRKMMIVRQLDADVCQRIGDMRAVASMPTYDELKARMQAYCNQITTSTGQNTTIGNKFKGKTGGRVQYSLVYSTRNNVVLAPEVWSDWWCRQEKPRIRDTFDTWIRNHPNRDRAASAASANKPVNYRTRLRDDPSEGGSMSYILEVLEGVKRSAPEKARELEPVGIEIGVFVIKKQGVQ
ncbi:hypothetical protein BT63DRAFT_153884 [Microthyrium microscopicum]|uniref:Uncharacterized protein n=1 Tax=Microthyrium microscopicum TaxID=703497 RepID=A0A6A6UM41_9PEZI|nr:hypothetical protein BT63DRAFT_153884 [Microthyrium microscopicum]